MHRAGDFRCAEFDKGLSVWSASLEKVGRPMYVTEPGKCTEEKFGVLWELTMPLRCPPTVQRALILVQPSLDQENVCCFKEVSVERRVCLSVTVCGGEYGEESVP